MTWRRWTVVGVVVLGSAIGAIYWRSGQVWDAMLARTDAKQKEMAAVPRDRPVLWGEATSGTSSADYDRACELLKETLAELSPTDGDVVGLLERWVHGSEADDEARDAFLASVQEALAALRRGAHRRGGRPPIAWADGFESAGFDYDTMFRVADVAALQVKRLVRHGEHDEAVRVILDAMQYGRDLFDDRRFLMSIVGGTVMYRPARLLALESLDPNEQPPQGRSPSILNTLSPDALALLDDGIAKLDRAPPWLGEAMATETVLLVRTIERPGGVDLTGVPMASAWEFGFASRFLVGDAVDRLFDTAAALPPSGGAWPDFKKAIGEAESDLVDSFNPLVSMVVPQLAMVEERRREVIANLRMLRLAVAAARGKTLLLADPFGGTLRSAVVDGRTRYWSVGPDGVDDGGDPNKDLVRAR